MTALQTLDVYVFYFDLYGVVPRFLAEGDPLLASLRSFQRAARRAFALSRPHTFVVTLYDNVWARVNASQPGTPSLLLDYAGAVMAAAEHFGFSSYYGAIARGPHVFEPDDRILIGKDSFEDLTEQHVDITSETHIRTVHAERWLRRKEPTRNNVIWVSDEVLGGVSLQAHSMYADAQFVPEDHSEDLTGRIASGGQEWPFRQALFWPIRPKRAFVGEA